MTEDHAQTGPAPAPTGWTPKTWLILAAMIVPVLAGGIYMAVGAERQTREDPAAMRLAAANAGTAIEVFTGPDHTVYHSSAALPTDAAPRADGKPTLVWFSNTNCSRCEDMTFAHAVAAEFSGRAVFVEKATDRDTATGAYAVTAAPTFVLIDARGKEAARFGYAATAGELRAAIAGALAALR